MKVARGSFYLSAQELKLKLDKNVTSSLPEVQTMGPLVKSGLLFSAASEVADNSGKRLGL